MVINKSFLKKHSYLDPDCEIGTNLKRFCYQIYQNQPGDQVEAVCAKHGMQILDTSDR